LFFLADCLTFRKQNFSRHLLLRKYGMLAGHPLQNVSILYAEGRPTFRKFFFCTFKWIKDYNTNSHYYNTKKNHFHTNVVITQHFFEH
jgi:hypothetical protein